MVLAKAFNVYFAYQNLLLEFKKQKQKTTQCNIPGVHSTEF